MALERVLSQDEIDKVFRMARDTGAEDEFAKKAQVYDFRRPDRIAKDQLRAIHLLHENFARSLASSLSAYLRAYVIVNLVSVEQLSFMEFMQVLPSPSIIVSMAMRPYDGSAVLELNPSLVFPVIEILLGGTSRTNAARIDREITEIEQSILDSLYRIILRDLQDAWRAVTLLDFEIESRETEPQMLQILSPTEAVVAISLEARIGDSIGMMNIGIPSITIKMLRQKFDQQWSLRKTESTEADKARILQLLRNANIHAEARLHGPTITMQNLLALAPGDILALDYSMDKELELRFNGTRKFDGHIVGARMRRAFEIQSLYDPRE